MSEKKFYYEKILKEINQKQDDKKRVFLDSQTKIAEELAKKIEFDKGTVELIEDSKLGYIAIAKLDLSKLQDQYIIENVANESEANYLSIPTDKKYIRTYILTNKDNSIKSLPICIQIVSKLRYINFFKEQIQIDCRSLLAEDSYDIYSYYLEKLSDDLSYSRKKPIVNCKRIISCKEKIAKSLLRKYFENIDEADLQPCISNGIKEIYYSKDISAISKKIKEKPKSIEEFLYYEIYNKIWKEFNDYLTLNISDDCSVDYDFLEGVVNLRIDISRKEYVTDISLISRKKGIDIGLAKRNLSCIFVDVTIKASDIEEKSRYSFKIFHDENNIKNIIYSYLN